MCLRSLFAMSASCRLSLAMAGAESGRSGSLFDHSLTQYPGEAPLPFALANLRPDVPVLTTLAEYDSLDEEYSHFTRIEEVDGQAVVIYHNETRHVATIQDQALSDLQSACGGTDMDGVHLGKRSRCSKYWCAANIYTVAATIEHSDDSTKTLYICPNNTQVDDIPAKAAQMQKAMG
ncbi:hypothetical protein DL771_005150 [Monosporascus sp. 5C6A]|nr:hypothetical protein DL771_005150 [Monosporascus sp. 5C6A]